MRIFETIFKGLLNMHVLLTRLRLISFTMIAPKHEMDLAILYSVITYKSTRHTHISSENHESRDRDVLRYFNSGRVPHKGFAHSALHSASSRTPIHTLHSAFIQIYC